MHLPEFLHQDAAGCGEEIHLARIDIIEVFPDNPDVFRRQEILDELRIALADIGRGERPQHIAAAENLGFEVLAPRAAFEQLVDQHFHRIGAIAHGCRDHAIVTAAFRQHEMVHAAYAADPVPDAG